MWFREPGRCKAVYFPTVFVNNIPLSVVSKQKYLGLMFDDTISWSHQVSKVCRSMSYYLYLLNKQKLIFKTDLFKLLIESLEYFPAFYTVCQFGVHLSVTLVLIV